jgi:hypothetical protein
MEESIVYSTESEMIIDVVNRLLGNDQPSRPVPLSGWGSTSIGRGSNSVVGPLAQTPWG